MTSSETRPSNLIGVVKSVILSTGLSMLHSAAVIWLGFCIFRMSRLLAKTWNDGRSWFPSPDSLGGGLYWD